jgi:hypothetical protein
MNSRVVTKDEELPFSLGTEIGTGANKSRFIPEVYHAILRTISISMSGRQGKINLHRHGNAEHNHVLCKLLMEILTIYLCFEYNIIRA